MAETIESIEERLGRMSETTKSMDKHFSHMGGSVTTLIKGLISAHAVEKSIEAVITQSRWGRAVQMAYHVAKADLAEMLVNQTKIASAVSRLRVETERQVSLGVMTRTQQARILTQSESQLALLKRQVEFKQAMLAIHPVEVAALSVTFSTLVQTYQVQRQINEALIGANSSLMDRLSLTRSVLDLQRRVGIESEVAVEAARDLVEYGYDLDKNFDSALNLVVKMRDGLGVSTKLGAELAVVYERQLKVSAASVADSMARVVNDTGLAADEAARMAVNIGRAVALLRPGIARDLGAVTELVGRYEGALKEIGGQFGGFQEMLSKMTTPEGLMQAGIIGVKNPAFLASEQATKQVIDSFAKYAKNFLGNTDGWDRALRLQSLAEMFGTTAQQVNLMVQAVDRANGQRHASITLEDRWKDQVQDSNKVFIRLRNSFGALLQEGALPLISVATAVANKVADAAQWLIKLKGAVIIATGAIIGGGVVAVYSLYSVTKAFYQMAVAAHIAARSIRAKAEADALGALPGASTAAAAGRASVIGRFIGAAAGPVIAVAVGAAIGIGIAALLRKQFGDGIEYKQVALKQSTDQAIAMVLRRQAISGDVHGVRESLIRARGMYLKDGLNLAQANDKIANQVKKLPEMVGRMRFTKQSAESSFGPTAEESAELNMLTEAQQELIDLAAQQRDNAVETRKIQQKHLHTVEQAAEDQKRDSLFQQAARAIDDSFSLRTAWDYWFNGKK